MKKMRKKAFTLPEILIASGIMMLVLLIGVGVMQAVSSTIYNGQTENRNRTSLSDNIYYMSREIQSAESIKISYDKKVLEIKQRGSSNYLKYEIKEDNPTSYLCFQSKKMLDLDFGKSSFDTNGENVTVTLAVIKNDKEQKQIPQIQTFHITPRSDKCSMEVEHAS